MKGGKGGKGEKGNISARTTPCKRKGRHLMTKSKLLKTTTENTDG